uniref:Pr1-like protein n=1 Tax=Oryza sativa subsp. japonica TaxID=39947 RepID=Q5Z467_ORYSJ|nr:pr1-like protein [Oryza sativa Japonica Group]BAD62446.1 pr1-like protein [Oryza sativa Japonica Group]
MAAAGRTRRRPRRHSRREVAHSFPDGRRRRPPARRRGARERGGKGETNRRSTAHPGSTATTGTATGAERGGGAARVDGDGGVPVVGDRNGEVDEVGEVAANPKKATPKREKALDGRHELDTKAFIFQGLLFWVWEKIEQD